MNNEFLEILFTYYKDENRAQILKPENREKLRFEIQQSYSLWAGALVSALCDISLIKDRAKLIHHLESVQGEYEYNIEIEKIKGDKYKITVKKSDKRIYN